MALATVTSPALLHLHAQDTASAPPSAAVPSPTIAAGTNPLPTPAHGTLSSFAVGAVGQLPATRIQDSSTNFVTQSLAPSAGLLATWQQSFSPWLGYAVNFGYTRSTFRYTAAPAAFGNVVSADYIPNNVYETSLSYIARKLLTPRFTLFGEAGGGTVAFAAITRAVSSVRGSNITVERSNTFRPAGIAGFGADYRLPHGLSLRAEYRGLFFQYPDYASGRDGFTTLTSEPSVSLAYTFGRHPQQHINAAPRLPTR